MTQFKFEWDDIFAYNNKNPFFYRYLSVCVPLWLLRRPVSLAVAEVAADMEVAAADMEVVAQAGNPVEVEAGQVVAAVKDGQVAAVAVWVAGHQEEAAAQAGNPAEVEVGPAVAAVKDGQVVAAAVDMAVDTAEAVEPHIKLLK